MAAVTKVNLNDRTRARMDVEAGKATIHKPHDIRSAIPMVDYTNPAKFPPYTFREYPKMPLLDNNRPIVINEAGTVLLFYDAADEVDFKADNPELAEEIERNTPARAIADVIAAQETEIEDMRARLRAAGLDTPARKKPVPNALANAVRNEDRPETTDAPEKAEGLRDTLPKSGSNPLKKGKH